MRRLDKPLDDTVAVFEKCIERVRDQDLKQRLEACKQEIRDASQEFDSKVGTAMLHTMQPSHMSNGLTTDEMKKVYTNRMAKKLAPGREYYDKLMSLPLFGKCPLCSQRTVSTLDHHLPKAHYPTLVVSPLNLIPACQDCNKTKSEGIPRYAHEETLHPYYDDVEGFSWLKARIVDTGTPVNIEFFVDPKNACQPLTQARIEHHFETFKLAKLYASHAAEELAGMEFMMRRVYEVSGGEELRNFLRETAVSHRANNQNSWQTGLYQCLSDNDWFCLTRFELS
ncbi:hypothetical protein CGI90_25720 [Vibrio parahaemolyticus]|uniref:HNH endonuclease n=1 Tax=Vibrio parahaemolyticus TaxID=670 RepID=UPI001123BB84|nr:hypothetical protein [Vibrio parahaemolyticus]TOH00168.1 hypothetical protein CGI90_25720 [Vibrio parahaemolyticus]